MPRTAAPYLGALALRNKGRIPHHPESEEVIRWVQLECSGLIVMTIPYQGVQHVKNSPATADTTHHNTKLDQQAILIDLPSSQALLILPTWHGCNLSLCVVTHMSPTCGCNSVPDPCPCPWAPPAVQQHVVVGLAQQANLQ